MIMNLQKIEKLIEKYENGETTSIEEKSLRLFFQNDKVPQHLMEYKDLFAFYQVAAKEELQSNDFDEKILAEIEDGKIISFQPVNRKKLYFISTIAAGILILLGIYLRNGINGSSLKETYNDPVLAYAETKKILMKVSSGMNAGVSEMKSIKEFNDGLNELEKVAAFQTGLNQLGKVTIFNKAQEIVTTKNK
jgi:hypothetical protein